MLDTTSFAAHVVQGYIFGFVLCAVPYMFSVVLGYFMGILKGGT